MWTLEEVKTYLRVDFSDDDALIQTLMDSALRFVKNVARIETDAELTTFADAKAALLYTVAYLYEHREQADHRELALTLRALLFGQRQESF